MSRNIRPRVLSGKTTPELWPWEQPHRALAREAAGEGIVLLKKMKEAFAPENDDTTEAAKEAVSDDMGAAMINYMPLRGILSFGGADTAPAIEQMLKALNNP